MGSSPTELIEKPHSDAEIAGAGDDHNPQRPAGTCTERQAARQATPLPADLQAVIDAWAELPADVRRTIVGVVNLSRPRR